MIFKIIFFIIIIAFLLTLSVVCLGEELDEKASYKQMIATAYCLKTQRCDGGRVRKGICAADSKYYGKVACVYRNDNGNPGEFVGYYEVLDHCPTEGVIDIWMPTYEQCMKFGSNDVLVRFIDGVG